MCLNKFVEFLWLNIVVALYHVHFATYNISEKHAIQLIPNIVWKTIYQNYLKTYPKAMFVDETLKKLNTSNSNEEGSK